MICSVAVLDLFAIYFAARVRGKLICIKLDYMRPHMRCGDFSIFMQTIERETDHAHSHVCYILDSVVSDGPGARVTSVFSALLRWRMTNRSPPL